VPRKPGALPPTAKPTRQALAAALRRFGLDDRGDAVQEWADLLTGAAGAKSSDDAFDALEWIVKTADTEGKSLVYARHAGEFARRWAARRKADKRGPA
jgi:hypothetical protein